MVRDSFPSTSGTYIVKLFVSGRFKGRDPFLHLSPTVCAQNKVPERGYHLQNTVYYRYYLSLSKSTESTIFKTVIV